jgi:WD40 repeat protein
VKRIPHDKAVKCIVAYKDVYALTGSSDGIIRVFDAKSFELVRELGKHQVQNSIKQIFTFF